MIKLTEVNTWWDNFRGRCIACKYSSPSTRKKEVICTLAKAALCRGLPDRPGGTCFGTPVHKLFGCIFFETAKTKET